MPEEDFQEESPFPVLEGSGGMSAQQRRTQCHQLTCLSVPLSVTALPEWQGLCLPSLCPRTSGSWAVTIHRPVFALKEPGTCQIACGSHPKILAEKIPEQLFKRYVLVQEQERVGLRDNKEVTCTGLEGEGLESGKIFAQQTFLELLLSVGAEQSKSL